MVAVIARGQPAIIHSSTPTQDDALVAMALLREAIAPPTWASPEAITQVHGYEIPVSNISHDPLAGHMRKASNKES